MAARLRAVGQRPINNVVDVSNYVMLELNQPNHAYDLATLGGGAIRVRSARDGEAIVTLDDVTRRVTADELLICDGDDRSIGLAGIMGGANTEIGDSTTTEEECAAMGGRKAQGGNGWMSHAWVVPGCESPWGVFSGATPLLDGELSADDGRSGAACAGSGPRERYNLEPGEIENVPTAAGGDVELAVSD